MTSTAAEYQELRLNGARYACISHLTEENASEFAATINQTPAQYDQRNPPVSTFTMDSWTGGLGIKWADFREHQGRFFFSSGADTRFSRNLTLGPLVQTLGVAKSTGNTITALSRGAITTFKNKDYFALEDKVFENASGTLTERLDQGTGTVSQLATYINASGTERLYAFFIGARFQYSANGTAWTQSDSGVVGRWAIEYDRNLIVLDGTANVGAIATSTVGDNLAASYTEIADFNTSDTSVISGIVYQNATGEPTIYFALADTTSGSNAGIWVLDYYARLARPLSITRSPQRNFDTNESFFSLAVWNSELYLPDRSSLLRYRQDGTVTDESTNKDEGLPTGYGPYGFLAPSRRDLFLTMGSGTTWAIGSQTSTGLHYLATESTPMRALYLSTVQSPIRVYWISAATSTTTMTVKFIELPIGTDLPVNDTTHQYAASGYIITPWYDLGFADLNKTLLSMTIDGQDLTSSETVVVSYQINGAGADDFTTGNTTLGTFDTDGEIVKFGTQDSNGNYPGIAVHNVRFKIALARGSTDTTTPKVRALTLRYIVNVPYRFASQCVIDLGKTIEIRGAPLVTVEDLMDELKATFNTDTLVDYRFGNDSVTRKVKMVTLPFRTFEQADGTRNGTVQIQCLQPLA